VLGARHFVIQLNGRSMREVLVAAAQRAVEWGPLWCSYTAVPTPDRYPHLQVQLEDFASATPQQIGKP
jgi:hypothetical protein